MLKEALAAWKKIPKKERKLGYDPATRTNQINRRETQYPDDGLGLRVYTRDMPRNDLPKDWRGTAWNVDSLWYRKDEAPSIFPKNLKKGVTFEWPQAMAHRLIRHNFVDNVRGQTNGYEANQVKTGTITTTVTKVSRGIAYVTFEGESHTAIENGQWARGIKTKIYGVAKFDAKKGKFLKFELVATGTRWGRTRFNFRKDDRDDSPIGFVVILDEKDEGRRVAPAEMGSYGW